MSAAVRAIIAQPVAEAKASVGRLVAASDAAALVELVTALTDDSLLASTSKPILAEIVENLSAGKLEDTKARDVCDAIVTKAGRRIGNFGEEVLRSRELLADIYEDAGRPQDALSTLNGIPLDTSLRSGTDAYKLSLWVRMAEIALLIDNMSQAETNVNRARGLVKTTADPVLRQRFMCCYAQVLDQNKKYLEAAAQYYAVSLQVEDYQDSLRKAIVCVVMENAGPARARLLANLLKDERVAGLGGLSVILAKVASSRILRERDVAALQPFLLPQHKAIGRMGRTAVDHAITQHNLLSASRLYFNINFAELGMLLGVAPREAEKIAAQMIAEDRLKATIDQQAELISFQAQASAPLQMWDQQIAAVCIGVSNVADAVVRAHPKFGDILKV